MPEIDDDRADEINFGLQLIIGELPKFFIIVAVALVLGILKETMLTFLILTPYRGATGGFHLKTHIGCIVFTCLFYCGVALLSKYIFMSNIVKIIVIALETIFDSIMVKMYAPADTENVPILSKKVRKQKLILSYIFLFLGLVIALFIKNNLISNIIIIGYFVQTLMITKIVYRITKCKYGYEVYQ